MRGNPALTMAAPGAMSQAFTQTLQAQRSQTLEMMGGLQRQSQEATEGMMVGTEGAGKGYNGQQNLMGNPKPILYKGNPTIYTDWKAKLLAYIRAVANRDADRWIAWASESETPIVENDLDPYFREETGAVKDCSVSLYAQLVSNTTGYPFSLVDHCQRGDGLERCGFLRGSLNRGRLAPRELS